MAVIAMKLLGVRLPEDLIAELKRLARERERSVSAEIRYLVRKELEMRKQEKGKTRPSREP